MKRTTFFLVLAVAASMLGGCSGDSVGGNPQMPPASQRIDNNHVPFQGSNPAPTGTVGGQKDPNPPARANGDPNG